MRKPDIELWYMAHKQEVVRHFSGRYGTDTVAAEDALQDVIVHLLARQNVYKRLTHEEFERVIWRGVDNRLKTMYTKEVKRRQVEGNYARERDD